MRRILLALVVVLALPSAAAARTRITDVDASRYPVVRVSVVADASQVGAPVVSENGTAAPSQVAVNAGVAKSIVLAVDRSRSMEGASLESAVAAARAFVASKPSRDRVSVVTFASRAVKLTRFSSATIDADTALRTIGVDAQQGTALDDAVVLGAQALQNEPLQSKVLVLVTDGNDVSSLATLDAAVAAARRAHVSVYTIGIEGPQFSPDPLRDLANRTGGSYHGASSTDALGDVYRRVGETLRHTWQVQYTTRARPGDRLDVAAGDAHTSLTLPGSPPPAPRKASKLLPYNPAAAFLVGGAIGLLLVLAFAAFGGARRGKRLRTRLTAHVEARGQARRRGRTSLSAAGTLMKATERAFSAFSLWARIEKLLARADVPMRTVEFVYIALGSSFVLAILATFLVASPFATLLAFPLGAYVPFGYLQFKARRRGKAFEEQLPDLLLTIAASLKAGHSFKQGLQTVADESEEPASKEFQRVLAEIRLGRAVEDALTEVAERVSSKNLAFVVTAVTIQSQVGGSLAGLFDMVADAVRQRQQFARKVKGLTAMGRASAYVLLALPFGLIGMIMLVSPDYLNPLWDTGAGHTMIVMTLVMMAFGSLILKKIVSFRG